MFSLLNTHNLKKILKHNLFKHNLFQFALLDQG